MTTKGNKKIARNDWLRREMTIAVWGIGRGAGWVGIDVREKKGKGHPRFYINFSHRNYRVPIMACCSCARARMRVRSTRDRYHCEKSIECSIRCDTYKPNHRVGGLDRKKRIYRRVPSYLLISSNSGINSCVSLRLALLISFFLPLSYIPLITRAYPRWQYRSLFYHMISEES